MKEQNHFSSSGFWFRNSLNILKMNIREFRYSATNPISAQIKLLSRKLNKPSFKKICIYVDRDYNLYGEPMSEDTTYQMDVGIEPITKLEYPYSNEQLEEFFKTVFGFCFSYYVEHDTLVNTRNNPQKNRSPIEKYMKAKSWKSAVKDLGLINISWYKKDGYRVSLYWQNAKMKNAFSGIGWEKDIIVPTDYQNCELAEAFRKYLDILAIGPFEKNPYENE